MLKDISSIKLQGANFSSLTTLFLIPRMVNTQRQHSFMGGMGPEKAQLQRHFEY